MPVLKVLTDKTLEERRFFKDLKDRFEKEDDLTKNPFKGRIDMISTESKLLTVMVLDPIYPDIVPKAGILIAAVSALFGWYVVMGAGLFLAGTFVLWTERFFFWVLKRSRKKFGVKGEIVLLSDKEAWEGVLRVWDK